MTYFLTSSKSGALPSASVPMSSVSLMEIQKYLQWETSVFASFPSLMGNAPMYMVPSVLGTDFPFSGWKEGVEEFAKARVNAVKEALSDKFPLGTPLTILSLPPDTTPLLPVGKLTDFDWGKYNPIKQNEHVMAVMKPGDTMFPEFIPASTYTLDTCSLLSEIQRHMLEPTIDGGITWSPLWTKAEVQKFFNNRLSRFFLETGVIQEEFSVDTSPGLSEYNYPEDLIQAKRLTFEEDLSLYDGLVSFWRLEESSGTRFDAFGPNDLGPFGIPSNATGKIGDAYLATSNSTGAFITASSQVGLDPGLGDFSISFWMYANSFISAGSSFISSLIGRGANGSTPISAGYAVNIFGDAAPSTLPRKLAVAFGDNASAFPYMQSHPDQVLSTATWYHVVLVFNRASFLQTYIDNVRVFASNDGGSDNMNFFGSNQGNCTPAAVFAIGALSQNTAPTTPTTGFSFDGRIDAVGYWNQALTKNEVATLWKEGNGRELYLGQHDGPYVVLPRQDPFSQDNGFPGWQDETGTPSIIIEEPRSPLSFQLSPTPDAEGSVEGIYVADPDDISDACTPLPIPNYLGWIIKYGVMSDMLRKEGEANDPVRAQYCENRWKEGVQLTRALLGFNNDYGEGGE